MMYLPIGGDMAVRTKAIVGIFGLDNTTTSRHTRQFLQLAEQERSGGPAKSLSPYQRIRPAPGIPDPIQRRDPGKAAAHLGALAKGPALPKKISLQQRDGANRSAAAG